MILTITDLIALLPHAVLLGWVLMLLLVDMWLPQSKKGVIPFLAAVGLAVSMVLVLTSGRITMTAFNGLAVVDGFARFLSVLFLASGIGAIAVSYDYLKRREIASGDYYVLLLLSIMGMLMMSCANDLIVFFLALELLSIPLYILAGFARPEPKSEEAAMKYFLLGTFASCFVLYGVAMIFGSTTHTNLPGIVEMVAIGQADMGLFLIGAGLLLVGVAFKIAAVPFHMWAPDVYQGAPSSVTAFMSVGAKAAAVAALFRVFVVAFPSISADLTPILWVMAALTMIVGNFIAVLQTNVKRLLAYSGIANAGYLLTAFVPYGQSSVVGNSMQAILFYLVGYGLASIGAWAVIIAMEKADGGGLELKDYAGLGNKNPLLALAMTVFMLSFTGVPLTLGFWGKFYLFRTAVEGGFIWLALIGLLTSLVSAYYYLRVVVIMYMKPGDPEVRDERWNTLTAVVATMAVVVFGVSPWYILHLVSQAMLRF